MVVIGVDSSTRNLNLGIYSEKVSIGRKFDTFRAHVEKIDYYLEELLKDAGMEITDIDAFCVTNGPGSYSGLRVGSAFVKGMMFERELDFISISTVYVMAFHYRESNEKIGVVYDIKHDKLVFADNREFKESIINEDNVREISWDSYKLIGNGIKLLGENFGVEGLNILRDGILEPGGEDVAYAGYLAIKSGQKEDIVHFEPRYFK